MSTTATRKVLALKSDVCLTQKVKMNKFQLVGVHLATGGGSRADVSTHHKIPHSEHEGTLKKLFGLDLLGHKRLSSAPPTPLYGAL